MDSSLPIWIHAFWWLAMGLGAVATILTYQIVYATNQYKDEGSRESYFVWFPGKMDRIFTEYERVFPEGRKVFWFKASFIAAGIALGTFVFASFWYSVMR